MYEQVIHTHTHARARIGYRILEKHALFSQPMTHTRGQKVKLHGKDTGVLSLPVAS